MEERILIKRHTGTELASTFSGGAGSGRPEFQEGVFLLQGREYVVSITSPQEVFDPREPVEENEIPAPHTVDGWVAWHRESPYLEVSDTQPASIGGATGVRFDLTATSAPEEATDLCGVPCVPGYPVGPTAVDFTLGSEEQDHVLEVGDEIVLVSVAAPTGELEGFLPKAQKVLDTVEWQGAF